MVTSIHKQEKRRERRRVFQHECWIVVSEEALPMPAYMSDISLSGTRLLAHAPDGIPDNFVLNITKDGRVHRRCKVVWRNNQELGVLFEGLPLGRKKQSRR